jgi:hypothetical protein
MTMAKKEERHAKHRPLPIEEEAKAAEHKERCEGTPPLLCPFYTKEGLVLIALAIILIAINNQYARYAAWVCLLAAFFVPMIKKALKKEG